LRLVPEMISEETEMTRWARQKFLRK
jgi:hypothetical protein